MPAAEVLAHLGLSGGGRYLTPPYALQVLSCPPPSCLSAPSTCAPGHAFTAKGLGGCGIDTISGSVRALPHMLHHGCSCGSAALVPALLACPTRACLAHVPHPRAGPQVGSLYELVFAVVSPSMGLLASTARRILVVAPCDEGYSFCNGQCVEVSAHATCWALAPACTQQEAPAPCALMPKASLCTAHPPGVLQRAGLTRRGLQLHWPLPGPRASQRILQLGQQFRRNLACAIHVWPGSKCAASVRGTGACVPCCVPAAVWRNLRTRPIRTRDPCIRPAEPAQAAASHPHCHQ